MTAKSGASPPFPKERSISAVRPTASGGKMERGLRFSTRTTPRVSAPTGTGARERGPAPASSSGGKWDRERTEDEEQIPSCYGISLFRYLRAVESEEERESIVRRQ